MTAKGAVLRQIRFDGRAIAAFRSAVGRAHVTAELADLREAEAATFRTSQRISAIVRPSRVEEVKACVEISNRYGIPIFPISRGKNWGYGSRVPVTSDSVMLDLQRMNRISGFNEEL